MGGGSQTVTQQQQYTANPLTQQFAGGVFNNAMNLPGPGGVPLQQIAPWDQYQNQAYANYGTLANAQNNPASPYFGAGQTYTAESASPASIQANTQGFLNPFASNVLGQLQNVFGQQQAQNNGNLVQSAGGVGADRVAVGNAQLANQQGLAAGQTLAGLYQPSLQAALGTAGLQQGAGALSYAAGPAALQSFLSGQGALYGAGQLAQQQAQNPLNALFQQQTGQYQNPFQVAATQSGVLGALGGALGGSQYGTTTYPPPSMLGQLGGLGMSGLGLIGGTGGFGNNGWLTNMFGGMGGAGGAGGAAAAGGKGAGMGDAAAMAAIAKDGGRIDGYDDGGSIDWPTNYDLGDYSDSGSLDPTGGGKGSLNTSPSNPTNWAQFAQLANQSLNQKSPWQSLPQQHELNPHPQGGGGGLPLPFGTVPAAQGGAVNPFQMEQSFDGGGNVVRFPIYPNLDIDRRLGMSRMKDIIRSNNPNASDEQINKAFDSYFGGGAKILNSGQGGAGGGMFGAQILDPLEARGGAVGYDDGGDVSGNDYVYNNFPAADKMMPLYDAHNSDSPTASLADAIAQENPNAVPFKDSSLHLDSPNQVPLNQQAALPFAPTAGGNTPPPPANTGMNFNAPPKLLSENLNDYLPQGQATPAGGQSGALASNPWMALLQAGLGTLAASGQRDARGLPMSGLGAIGAGGLKGMQMLDQQRKQALAEKTEYDRVQEAARAKMLEAQRANMPFQQLTAEQRMQALQPKRIGQTVFGEPIFGVQSLDNPGVWINPATGKPIDPQAVYTGDESSNDPRIQGVASQIYHYQIPPISPYAMQRGSGAAIMTAVQKMGEEAGQPYDAQFYQSSQQALKNFATGRQGDTVRSFNVVAQHLDVLEKLTDAMQNGKWELVNALRNEYKKQGGVGPDPTNFDSAASAVRAEIVKAIEGSRGALGDRESIEAGLNKNLAPDLIHGTIGIYKSLMIGQLKGLEKQYEDSTRRGDFQNKLSDRTKEMFNGATVADKDVPNGANKEYPKGTEGPKPQTITQGGYTYTLQPDGSYK